MTGPCSTSALGSASASTSAPVVASAGAGAANAARSAAARIDAGRASVIVSPRPGTRNAVWRARFTRSPVLNAASFVKICRSAQYRTRVPVTPFFTLPMTRSSLPDVNGANGASGPMPCASSKTPGSPRWNDMA